MTAVVERRASPGRLYADEVVARALEHRAAGWTRDETRTLLHREFGVRPAVDTLRCWEDPSYLKRRRAWKRASYLRTKPDAARGRLGVMRELYLRGLSLRAIGQATAVFLGEEMSEGEVLAALGMRPGEVVRSITGRRAA